MDPMKLELHEIGRLRAAASHARRVFPGPVGELLARELTVHAEFGYRLGQNELLPRLARDVLALRTARAAEVHVADRPERAVPGGGGTPG